MALDYDKKLASHLQKISLENLPRQLREQLRNFALRQRLSFQNLRQSVIMLTDLLQWEEEFDLNRLDIKGLQTLYDQKKKTPNIYPTPSFSLTPQKVSIREKNDESVGFGRCPVASPNTRCCNLLTLDSVESCGFDCSYCSIQSFYNQNSVTFNVNLEQKLQNLQLDPNQLYHIGTGQSSDSLMWGDKYGNLSALNDFASKNPNIILEYKTKSDNIGFFMKNRIAYNSIVTFSLNPQTIIDNEEHFTASLHRRIDAAKKLHDKGILVGFHFHPIIQYSNWQREYTAIAEKLTGEFDPDMVALISFGTLTFIKPVLKQIRARKFKTKILQMPMSEANGKLSYPRETKLQLFQTLYNAFAPWHDEVFFYLCMEDQSLWEPVFGRSYPTNESFEMDMKLAYRKKIDALGQQ
ncbi:MAG: radical SAM protein [Campylobacterota bacterium]